MSQETINDLKTLFDDDEDVTIDGNNNFLDINGEIITCHVENEQIIVTNLNGQDVNIKVPF